MNLRVVLSKLIRACLYRFRYSDCIALAGIDITVLSVSRSLGEE